MIFGKTARTARSNAMSSKRSSAVEACSFLVRRFRSSVIALRTQLLASENDEIRDDAKNRDDGKEGELIVGRVR